MKIAILYSGGLDSRMMLHYAHVKYPQAEVSCIYWAHGHNAQEAEIETLEDYVDVRHVDWLNKNVEGSYLSKKQDSHTTGKIYIPGRNLVFSVLAACEEMADEVWIGALAEEGTDLATDKNQKFFNLATDCISYVLSPWKDKVTVRSPFADEGWSKEDTLEWCLKNGLSKNEIKKTISCYHLQDKGKHGKCGNCSSCMCRFMLFGNQGFDELDSMDTHPLKGDVGIKWLKNIIDDLNKNNWNTEHASYVQSYFKYFPKYVKQHGTDNIDVQYIADSIEKHMGV